MSESTPKLDRRAFLALAGGTGIALGMPGLALGAPAVRTAQGRAFATEWAVSVPDSYEIEALRPAIDDVLALVDVQMSPWRNDSHITMFNRSRAGTMQMPSELVEVTSSALRLSAASNGEFDPTVGPLVSRYGFGPIEGDSAPGWQEIGLTGDALSKSRDGLTLDLCGIAKGYALDRMAGIVKEAGVSDFLIDLGGELVACGKHPSGRSWHVAIEDPRPGISGAVEVLDLGVMAVATSGNRANGYDIGTRRYSHIIDPLTHEPANSNLLSASVIAETAMIADGWATALMAAGAERGAELARHNNVSALFVLADPNGLRTVSTGSFSDYLA